CLRLESFAPTPLPKGDVRVAVHAAGINFPDILMAAGEYQLKPELPFTPGVEAAGEVTEIGEGVTGFTVGDRVIVKMRHGAYADEAMVSPSQLIPLPSTFDYAEGATFLAAHGTAYHALIDRGQVRPGEVLLVHGAGGGVGTACSNRSLITGASLLGVRGGEGARRSPGPGAVRIKSLVDWAEAGKIRSRISHRLPLEDYAKAMRLLIERKAIGRVALIV